MPEECKSKFREHDPAKCGALVLVDFPGDIFNDCVNKFPGKACEALSCGLESTEALSDGVLVKEKFLEAYELGIETDYASSKEVLIPLLPKAIEACKTLGMSIKK